MLFDLYSWDSCLLEGLFSLICDKNFPFILEIIIFQELVKKKVLMVVGIGKGKQSFQQQKSQQYLLFCKNKFN